MYNRQDQDHVVFNSKEDREREATNQCAPCVSVNDRIDSRRFLNRGKGREDFIKKLMPEIRALRLIPYGRICQI